MDKIALGLAVISAVRDREGFYGAMTCEEIAEICGTSKQAISQIEQRALAKVRARLKERIGQQEYADAKQQVREL